VPEDIEFMTKPALATRMLIDGGISRARGTAARRRATPDTPAKLLSHCWIACYGDSDLLELMNLSDSRRSGRTRS
jgi:hypothetical protein